MVVDVTPEAPDLAKLLRNYTPGAWVVLDTQMRKVLSSATTAHGALEAAQPRMPASISSDRPVLLQVPDPKASWSYSLR